MVLIMPSSWGSQRAVLTSHQAVFLAPLPGIEEEEAPTSTKRQQRSFSHVVAGEEEDFCKGSLARTLFYFVYCFALLYFCLLRFIKNTKKLASFIVVTLLLLVHYVVP
jgi:hypothetical protein